MGVMDTNMPHAFTPEMLFTLCEAAGLRPTDIARALQVSKPTVTGWRQGTQRLSKEHYAELLRLAYSPPTFWRLLHRMKTGQIKNEDNAHGHYFAIAQSPDDYQGWIRDAFRAAVAQVNELVSGDSSAWHYDTIRIAPSGKLTYSLDLPQAPVCLRFDAAMYPDSWQWGGDGASFTIAINRRMRMHRRGRLHFAHGSCADCSRHALLPPTELITCS